MKALMIALGTALSLVAVSPALACDGAKTADASEMKADSSMKMASFSVDGMSCAVSCPVQIKTALAGLSGVNQVAVDFDTKSVKVQYTEAEVTKDQMIEAITKLGYKAAEVVEEKAAASAKT